MFFHSSRGGEGKTFAGRENQVGVKRPFNQAKVSQKRQSERGKAKYFDLDRVDQERRIGKTKIDVES